MPLTSKGEKIMENMKEEYGPKKGESVFYASANKGTIKGVHNDSRDQTSPDPASGPMSTRGPNPKAEGLPSSTEPFKGSDAGKSSGKEMSLDDIKSSAKRIGRY